VNIKKALITGITGQDGAYLAELLLSKGYQVHGLRRRSSSLNIDRIEHLLTEPQDTEANLFLHYGDLSDSSCLNRLMQEIQPDEVYNLGAQSHVHVSFDSPEYTADVDALGTLRLLEAIRIAGLCEKTRFYQASTSELYGKIQQPVQSESTPFYPRSPYAVAKLYAYWITVNYREAYNIYACNGILFNHESPLRGQTFVTKKITNGISRLLVGIQNCLYMGNIDAERDWGHARDYVEMQWLMLQQEQAEDYVIATGRKYSVRDFINFAFKYAGIELGWVGEGVDEYAVVTSIDAVTVKKVMSETPLAVDVGDIVVRIDPFYFRPTEVDTLLGDASKAKEKLGWKAKTTIDELINEMMAEDIESARRDLHVEMSGFKITGKAQYD